MTFFTRTQYEQLIQNGSLRNIDRDPQPVVKLHMERVGCVWLLTELNPQNPFIAFGLADLNMQHPELGSIDLQELYTTRLPLGVTLEQDEEFIGLYPISVYARAAGVCGYITDDQDILRRHQFPKRSPGLYPV